MCAFGVTPLGFQADMAAWADALDTLADLAPVIIPGHGPVGGEREVRECQGYLRACLAANGDPAALGHVLIAVRVGLAIHTEHIACRPHEHRAVVDDAGLRSSLVRAETDVASRLPWSNTDVHAAGDERLPGSFAQLGTD